VELVVTAGTDRDVTLGDDIPRRLSGPYGVAARCDEHQCLPAILDVGEREIEGPVQAAVLVGEFVLAMGVGPDTGLKGDRSVLVAEVEQIEELLPLY
jgi:hypothetical protein